MNHIADRPGARIVLVRPDHLGDVLLTLPAVATLRRAVPDSHITYLVADGVGPVPRHCPDVDATITVPFPPLSTWSPAPGWSGPPGWTETLARVAPDLRGRFDLAILPRADDPVSGALVAAAGVPIRLGYAAPRTQPFLTVAVPMLSRKHVAVQAIDLALAALDHLGARYPAEYGGPVPCFVPTAAEEDEASAVLGWTPSIAAIGPIVLHPGSGWPLKNWPVRRWGQLAAELACRYGVTPLITGGPHERDLVGAVVETSGRRARGLAGCLSLGGLAALFRRAQLVVAIDSGPLHLAAMLGAPSVGLYGPADPLEFGPWCATSHQRIVRVQLPCSPCRTLVEPPCGAVVEPPCVTEISVAAVLAVAAELMAA